MIQFEASNLQDMAKWLRRQANEADAKISGLARCKSEKKYYEGQRSVYNNLAAMIESGELVITHIMQDAVLVDYKSVLIEYPKVTPENPPTMPSIVINQKVTFCSWCEDPNNPDPKFHPQGNLSHDTNPVLRDKEKAP